jgi:signal transduction histidine kinase
VVIKSVKNLEKDRMQWVILLLAGAVILPTICLLWFMTQAVKNERFAVRQRILNFYDEKLSNTVKEANQELSQKYQNIETTYKNPSQEEILKQLYDTYNLDIVYYDGSGKVIWPVLSSNIEPPADISIDFNEAWQYEFVKKDYNTALEIYSQKTSHTNNYIRFSAIEAKVRCLVKLNETNEAIKILEEALQSPEVQTCDNATLSIVAREAMNLFELKKAAKLPETPISRASEKLINIITTINKSGYIVPLDTSVLLLNRLPNMMWIKPHNILTSGNKALTISEIYGTKTEVVKLKQFIPQRVYIASDYLDSSAGPVFVARINLGDNVMLFSYRIEKLFSGINEIIKGTELKYRVHDADGNIVMGSDTADSLPILSKQMDGYFNNWKIELLSDNDNLFLNTANKQIAIYIWTGVLVIALILGSGVLAGRTISRQIKINKLKNDFIATVTHELKTPLASMRVLADTLLEGNYTDQKQVHEYLELICKENKRLTGLIDNFLTFSRMERNKQVFEFKPVSPSEISKAAIEAINAKFSQKKCIFSVTIDDNLTSIYADRNAMVTVLVNLLDNACKYTYDNKQIELRVFREDNNICFAVKDNGIGMTRRQMRKIFDKFYQVDNTLSRRTEGTGLGLSIVKFILDAHKGKIEVYSEMGKGSTFIVKMPIFKDIKQN